MEEVPGEAPAAPVEEGPLSSRIESKAWKARMEAYEELAKLLEAAEEGDGVFDEYAEPLSKAVKDSNVNAQDKALEASLVLAKRAPVDVVGRVAAKMIGFAVDKAFTQAKCKSKAQDLAYMLIEAECGEVVAESLIAGCGHKQPKISGASAECLRSSIEQFGLKPLGAQGKAIVKLSVTMFDSTVAPVRAEAKPIAVELFKYMGAALRPSYENLRPAQQKEIDEAFAEAGKPQPSRMTRTAAAKVAAAAAAAAAAPAAESGGAAPATAPVAEEVDALDLFDPVSILDKLPKDWCDAVLVAPKWQEKKEMLEVLMDLAKAPKLASGDYGDVVKSLKKLMGDSMVLVVSTSVTALGMLSKGLGKEFSHCAKVSTATLLDKLKEKDKRVIEAVHTTLDTVFSVTLSLETVADDVCVSLGPKGVAKAKPEILKFIKRIVDAKPAAISPKSAKPIVDAVAKACDDSTPEIRDNACAALAAFISACGPAPFKSTLDALDDKKRKKVEGMVSSGSAAPAPTPAAAAAPPAIKPALKKPSLKSAAPPAEEAAADPPPAPVPKRVPSGKSAGGGAKAAAKEPKEEGGDVASGTPVEQLDELAQSSVPADVLEKLASTNWKERLEAAEAIETLAREGAAGMAHPLPEALVRLLAKAVVDKKETNFQVAAKAYSAVQALAELAPKFTKRAAHWFVGVLVEKLGDVKLRTPASDCLLMLAEAVTPQFVLSQATDALEKQKSPKVQENALLWINTLAADFGLKLIKPKPLLDYVKGTLEAATNPLVKKAAIEVLATMRRQLGPDVRGMLSDVKPALLVTIDEAFAKVAAEAPAAEGPKRQVKGGEEEAPAAEEGTLVNLTSAVTAHLKTLGDANWKERQAALTALDELITKAKPLGCTGVYMEASCGDLWAALKARLKDSNKNLATQALALLAKLAGACGQAVERYAKTVMPNMLTLISDNKKTVRDAVLNCLSAWAACISPETLLRHLPVAVSVDAPAGREDAVKWAAEYLTKLDSGKAAALDLQPLLVPVMESLEHRVTEVRAGAEKCLQAIIMCSGAAPVHKILRDMKPAQLKTIKPLCDKAEKLAAAASSSSPDAPPPAPAAEEPAAPAPQAAKADPVRASVPGVGGLKRGGSVRASEPAVVVAAAQEPTEEAPMRVSGQKEAREKKHGKMKWVLDDAQEALAHLQSVSEQMESVLGAGMHAGLFAKDFKKQIEALKELTLFVRDHPTELTSNLDLVLKMCSLRMCGRQANTSVVLAVLDMLKAVFEVLVQNEYRLTEMEAGVCLPCLMEEVGGNNDTQRKLIRDLLKKATQVYPASKIFSLLVDTAHHTRNQKARAEALSEMAALIERLGLDQVGVAAKALPQIGGYVAERDVNVRNAALDCLVASHQSSGDKVWKYLNKLEPKEKDMLTARLKKSGPPRASATPDRSSEARKSGPSQPAAAEPAPPVVDVRASMPAAPAPAPFLAAAPPPLNLETPVRPSRAVINELLDAPTPTINTIKSRFHTLPEDGGANAAEPLRSNEEISVRSCIRAASSGTNSEKLAALKHISALVGQDYIAPHATQSLVKDADSFVSGVHGVISKELAHCADGDAYRLVKHALYTAHQVFSQLPEVASAVTDHPLSLLVEELLLRLHDPQVPSTEEYEVLFKMMNDVVMDVLHHARPNKVYTLLIRFLYEGAPLSGGRECSVDFVDGVLRCLLEMARCMATYIDVLDIDLLLYDAHMFLVAHPPSKYRGREFRPLRLLKTILNELVKIKGEAIRTHLTLVPVDTKPTICSYLDLVLQQMQSKNTAEKKSGGEESLTVIFDKIGSKDKEVAKDGFRLLYEYRLKHPTFSLEQYLNGRSPQFQEHVHKNLAKVHAQAEASQGLGGDTVSSAIPLQNAMSTNNKALASSAGAGALLDKLQGIRSQLGIAPAEEAKIEMPTKAQGGIARPVASKPEAGGEGGKPVSVMSLQERLARLKSS